MSDATVRPDAIVADRWEPVRFESCPVGKRVVDVNHARRQVSWRCPACRKPHILTVGHDLASGPSRPAVGAVQGDPAYQEVE